MFSVAVNKLKNIRQRTLHRIGNNFQRRIRGYKTKCWEKVETPVKRAVVFIT